MILTARDSLQFSNLLQHFLPKVLQLVRLRIIPALLVPLQPNLERMRGLHLLPEMRQKDVSQMDLNTGAI